jgi:type II restriction enzyme
VNLRLPAHLGKDYKSAPQRTRVITEAWGKENLYCVNCDASQLQPYKANNPASDYLCDFCNSRFQLKSQGRPFGNRIQDAAYAAMLEAIERDETPNLLALHYNPEKWTVTTLVLIPRFAFSASAIIPREPLRAGARRHGWVGCYISLAEVPPDARIPVVQGGKIIPPREVRRAYERLKPLARLDTKQRGWTLDVWNIVRRIGKRHFTLSELYAFEAHFKALHPNNRHIRAKVRQQLQVLRDLGFLDFRGGGEYRIR